MPRTEPPSDRSQAAHDSESGKVIKPVLRMRPQAAAP
jgi:hypothetical protein